MERIVFRKVELWVVGLIVVIGLLGVVAFGAMVRSRAMGFERYGMAGDVAIEIASIPATLKDILEQDDRMTSVWNEDRFVGKSGWTITPAAGAPEIPGYLLLSRFDGDLRAHVVELVDLRSFETVRSWSPSGEQAFDGVSVSALYVNPAISDPSFRAIHPLLMENGDLIIKDHYAPLARVDACGRPRWQIGIPVHHATERGPDGSLWIPAVYDPPMMERAGAGAYDDMILSVSPEGEVIFQRSLGQMLIDNGYGYLVNGMHDGYEADRLHLNDIQPVMEDGEFWNRGDLFLNMRNRSTVALYRPSTDKIIWLRSGPWSFQHDVDIVGDGVIAVFDNNVSAGQTGLQVNGANRIMAYDFTSDTARPMMAQAFAETDVRTITEGLFTLLPSGHVLVEEENYGRLLIFAPDGSVAAEYVNGAGDGKPYRMGWSRYIDEAQAQRVLAATATLRCGAAGTDTASVAGSR